MVLVCFVIVFQLVLSLFQNLLEVKNYNHMCFSIVTLKFFMHRLRMEKIINCKIKNNPHRNFRYCYDRTLSLYGTKTKPLLEVLYPKTIALSNFFESDRTIIHL